MSQQTKLQLEQEVIEADIPGLAADFDDDEDGLQECMGRVQDALNRIRIFPLREGKECEYEPLRSEGCRSVKLFASNDSQRTPGSKPELRIIYRYVDNRDIVQVLSIGFRRKQRPRPAHDPYNLASTRLSAIVMER